MDPFLKTEVWISFTPLDIYIDNSDLININVSLEIDS